MIYRFPQNFVYWQKVECHDKIKQKYYDKILENENIISNNSNWLGKLKTSFHHQELNKFIQEDYFINNVVWKYFDSMLHEMKDNIIIPIESFISCAWYNLYQKGDFQEVHQHDKNYVVEGNKLYSNSFCGIYLLHLEETNKTIFYQEPPVPCSVNNSGVVFDTSFLEEGNVIFFPSGLSHYVLPSESKRCTVSFNITSVYNNSQ